MKPDIGSLRHEASLQLMWKPDLNKWRHLNNFRCLINQKYGVKLENYHDFYKWSCDNYAEFWEEFWHYSLIVHSQPYQQVVDKSKRIDQIPQWFTGAELNFAENLLKHPGDKVALYGTGEGKSDVEIRTFNQLRCRVAQYAASMKVLGIQRGDRVVGYMPNCIETVEAMLAATSLGAIWSSTSPDFGSVGVLERFSQIRPKLIFSVVAVTYNGKRHSHLEKLLQVLQGLPELLKVVLVPFIDNDRQTADISKVKNGCWLDEFLNIGQQQFGSDPPLEFVQVPFNHPLYIMYSSGTTGMPKCMVHSVGGTLIQHLKEHVLQGNLTEQDVIMYYTTTGWMMWNWLITALAVGAAVVLYDGSPFVPDATVLWDLVDRLGITILGTGARYLVVLEEKGVRPIGTHSLSTLHTILSTGSPLKPCSYEYVYRDVKKDVMLGSISGGTDIIGCFMGQNPTLPVYKGEIQSRHLAMAVECWNDEGEPVLGQSGELVCTKPHPSMPVYFWNDPDGSKYHNAYFAKYDGVWCHGDFCLINRDTGGIRMLGRSDGTLNPNGVRFGSAEIYNVVESFKEIEDSLCLSQRYSCGEEERVILFVKMVPGHTFNEELIKRIKVTIQKELSSRHIPAFILEIKDIPYTISGKKVEVAARDIIEGRAVKYRGTLSNPDALDLFKSIPELTRF